MDTYALHSKIQMPRCLLIMLTVSSKSAARPSSARTLWMQSDVSSIRSIIGSRCTYTVVTSRWLRGTPASTKDTKLFVATESAYTLSNILASAIKSRYCLSASMSISQGTQWFGISSIQIRPAKPPCHADGNTTWLISQCSACMSSTSRIEFTIDFSSSGWNSSVNLISIRYAGACWAFAIVTRRCKLPDTRSQKRLKWQRAQQAEAW